MNLNVVCPRCGSDASQRPASCTTCGLDLSAQYALPTREEWLARQDALFRGQPAAPPPAAIVPPVPPAPVAPPPPPTTDLPADPPPAPAAADFMPPAPLRPSWPPAAPLPESSPAASEPTPVAPEPPALEPVDPPSSEAPPESPASPATQPWRYDAPLEPMLNETGEYRYDIPAAPADPPTPRYQYDTPLSTPEPPGFPTRVDLPAGQDDPYAQSPDDRYAPPAADPYAQRPADPYAQRPADPYQQPPADPYAQQPWGRQPDAPYGQPPAYGQHATNPYARTPASPYGQPPADPYGQPASPYGQPQAAGVSYARGPEQAGSPGAGRNLRDLLLTGSGFGVAVGALLGAIGALVLLLDNFSAHAPGGLELAQGVTLIGQIVEIPAAVAFGLAFLAIGPKEVRLRQLLARGFAAYFILLGVADVIGAATYFIKSAPTTGGAALIVQGIGWGIAGAAALLADRAFAMPDRLARYRALGTGTALFAGAAAVLGIAAIVQEIFLHNLISGEGYGVPGSISTGQFVLAAGFFILAGAAGTAAYGLTRSSEPAGLMRNDLLLCIGAGVGALAFLLEIIGTLMPVSYSSQLNGSQGATWLQAFYFILVLLALIAASVAFGINRARGQRATAPSR